MSWICLQEISISMYLGLKMLFYLIEIKDNFVVLHICDSVTLMCLAYRPRLLHLFSIITVGIMPQLDFLVCYTRM